MNTKLFSEAISEVGDKYYEEAANYHCKKHGWIKWSAMAACLTIVLFTAFSILPAYFHQRGATPPDNPNAAGRDLAHYEARLKEFLSGWLGGPPLYLERHGMPMLREGHRRLVITQNARYQWMSAMRSALAETVSDPEVRLRLEGAFAKMAESLVNTDR